MKKVYVVNSKKEKELFSFRKVYRSCKRSGASDDLARKVTEKVQEQIYPGIKTYEIYKFVRKLLKESPVSAIRFSLKEAMRKLGPSGFDFEKYISQIFQKNGFKVKTNQIIAGKCVSFYEIDFLAEKNTTYFGECKYHMSQGERVDLKVALYNYARFLDILKNPKFNSSNPKAIIVTNTKFTTQAIKYCRCVNVDLLGWKYPENHGLESLIEKHKLYPVTILPSFKAYFKNIFAENKMMLALDLLDAPLAQLVKRLKLPLKEVDRLVEEAKILLK